MRNQCNQVDEEWWQLKSIIDKIDAPNCDTDQNAASEQRKESQSGRWVLQNDDFQAWCNVTNAGSNPLLYINGIPGAVYLQLMDEGKTVLASLIIETLLKQENSPVLFFYCKHREQDKSTFAGILRGLLAQLIRKDTALVSWFSEKCSSLDRQKLRSPEILEELARFAFNTQCISLVVLDGLDECNPEEIRKTISWFVSHQGIDHAGTSQIRLMCIGQRIDILQTMLSSAKSVSLDNSCHRDDIAKYVAGKTRNIQKTLKIKPDIVSQIVSRVTKTAKGLLFQFFSILGFYISL
ncbi:hypothetical protein V8E54_013989 [Elaphomyces granulatus]